ncbi:hypothetical protein AAV94_11255 [Lampropedia cohaerens]|uniref:HIT domain-containing protein n=1 Tax=Lampropedia cohaerens TaxID=1610491 RepID=A0A0U1PYG1_9BURK|nr:HIT family protein [Lampropedia cohaerens]KKW67405.1 hypothetical protein AAV94_11255 [Lampropedia cohaerens]
MTAPCTPKDAQCLTDCPLCQEPGGRVIYHDAHLRVVHADEPGLPAFYRVIWRAHVREWTDLPEPAQLRCLRAVAAVEQAMRDIIAPDKVNLATLGNMVAHLHWHVIARYRWDAWFPAPVWAAPQRALDAPEQRDAAARLAALREPLEQAMCQALTRLPAPPA